MRLAGRVALVTGASRGIGRALAIGLAREGVAVAVNVHTRPPEAIPRRGQPGDIVGAVTYLASDEASFVTGQTINVDGGWAHH